ncbi:collagen alpha-1(XV) chain-like, partial [Penaeus monodon]|uniref:collagen alpha-1(XV) chain-like n=1 Tax=Penaeus monodon TaxID=6687 RepID=UPI0018A7A2D1
PVKYIWHGANKYGETAYNLNCNSWSSSSSSAFGMASSLNSLQLLDQKKIACDNQLIVLCIETTSSLPKRRKRTVVEEENEDRSEDEIGEGKTENGKEREDPEALRKNEKDDEEETDFPAYSPVSQPLESTSPA